MSIKPVGYVSTGTPEEIKAAYESTRQGFEYMCIACSEPLVYSKYPFYLGNKIWEVSEGFFVYADEADNFSDNIYTSVHDAEVALNNYADWLCYGPDETTIGEAK